MDKTKAEVTYGTLELVILRTLETVSSRNGFGLARRIELTSESLGHLNQASIYPALVCLQQKGWIEIEEGASSDGRQVKFYSLTAKGRKVLRVEIGN